MSAAVLLAAAALLAAAFFVGMGQGGYAEVYVDGSLQGKYPLDRDLTIEPVIGVVIRIENGEAFFYESDCPDKVCVLSGHIRRPGAIAVCAPRRVAVKITGSEGEADAVAR